MPIWIQDDQNISSENLEVRKAFWSASLQATGLSWSLDELHQGLGSFPTTNFWYKNLCSEPGFNPAWIRIPIKLILIRSARRKFWIWLVNETGSVAPGRNNNSLNGIKGTDPQVCSDHGVLGEELPQRDPAHPRVVPSKGPHFKIEPHIRKSCNFTKQKKVPVLVSSFNTYPEKIIDLRYFYGFKYSWVHHVTFVNTLPRKNKNSHRSPMLTVWVAEKNICEINAVKSC